jgi:hypothetical protein
MRQKWYKLVLHYSCFVGTTLVVVHTLPVNQPGQMQYLGIIQQQRMNIKLVVQYIHL